MEWFDQQTSGMIGGIAGTFIGACGGLIGFMSGYCARKGLKKLFFGMIIFILTICLILFLVGITALILRQPYHVWYTFLLPGGLGGVIIATLLPLIKKRFTECELRQMQSQDL